MRGGSGQAGQGRRRGPPPGAAPTNRKVGLRAPPFHLRSKQKLLALNLRPRSLSKLIQIPSYLVSNRFGNRRLAHSLATACYLKRLSQWASDKSPTHGQEFASICKSCQALSAGIGSRRFGFAVLSVVLRPSIRAWRELCASFRRKGHPREEAPQ